MRFDENLRQFVYEYEGIIFAWDEEPGEDFPDTVKKLAANYYERLDDIVRHIAPDLKEMYGITDPGEIKRKLGNLSSTLRWEKLIIWSIRLITSISLRWNTWMTSLSS